MLLVFDSFFLAPVISRIDSIGGGWVGGGRVGGEPKAGQSTHTQRAVLCLQ